MSAHFKSESYFTNFDRSDESDIEDIVNSMTGEDLEGFEDDCADSTENLANPNINTKTNANANANANATENFSENQKKPANIETKQKQERKETETPNNKPSKKDCKPQKTGKQNLALQDESEYDFLDEEVLLGPIPSEEINSTQALLKAKLENATQALSEQSKILSKKVVQAKNILLSQAEFSLEKLSNSAQNTKNRLVDLATTSVNAVKQKINIGNNKAIEETEETVDADIGYNSHDTADADNSNAF